AFSLLVAGSGPLGGWLWTTAPQPQTKLATWFGIPSPRPSPGLVSPVAATEPSLTLRLWAGHLCSLLSLHPLPSPRALRRRALPGTLEMAIIG
ncbi:hypothetical protein MC885_004128, partial [Smutsia gigantea]